MTEPIDPQDARALSRRAALGGLFAVALLWPTDGDARVGGGHRRSSSSRSSSSSSRSSSSSSRSSSSSGRSSSSSRRSSSSSPYSGSSSRSSSGGRSSGSGSGSGSGSVMPFLSFVIIALAIFFHLLQRQQKEKERRLQLLYDEDVFDSDRMSVSPAPQVPAGPKRNFPRDLQSRDPAFSGALFRDYALLVYTRVIGQLLDRSAGRTLKTLILDRARESLRSSLLGWSELGLVTIGHHTVALTERQGSLVIEVTFFGNITVRAPGSSEEVLLDREETWTFGRPAGSRSPTPERLRSLSCVACGNTGDPGFDGRCPSCDGPRTEGAPQWRVIDVRVAHSERAPAPMLPLGGGPEPGLDHPTVRDGRLRRQKAAFLARHPRVDLDTELDRLARMFVQMQEAWTCGGWESARPLMSDALFTANQGWLEQLKRAGMRNRTVGVKVSKMDLCSIEVDQWVEVLTVRIFASCLDWTDRIDGGGIVGGSATERRSFSEYWTFLRAVGAHRKSESLKECPSCGAPLDQMAMTGICGYCDSKVSSGDFDWVATRISQDDDVR